MKPNRRFYPLAALGLTILVVGAACSDDPVAPGAPAGRALAAGAHTVVISSDITALDLGANAIAFGINDDGDVVGRSGNRAAWWSPAGDVRLIPSSCAACLPGDSSAAMDIDNQDRIVGFYTVRESPNFAPVRGAFMWSESGSFEDLGWLGTGSRSTNPSGTTAYAISESGVIVGESPRPTGFAFEHAFARTPAGVMQDLTPSITDWSRAYAVNAAGDMVGFAVLPGPFGSSEHPIVWRAGSSMLDLGTFGGPSGNARAINSAGVVVGAAMNSSSQYTAFRWTPATGLQPLPGTGGWQDLPKAINDRGFIAGETNTFNPPYRKRAIVWTPDGRVIDLGTLGGANSSAYAINSTGQVAGMSEDASGQKHAVRWDIRSAANRAPLVNAGGPYRGVEGSAIAFDRGSATDPDGDVLTSSWSFGDGATSSGLLASHSYVDNGTYTATLTATDPGGLTARGTASVLVSNVPPTVHLDEAGSITSGESFRLRGTFSDPGVNDAPWRYVVNWSNGTPTSGTTSDQTAALLLESPRYCATGSYEVWLTVTDKDDGARSAVIRATVSAIPATVQSEVSSLNPRSKGTFPVAILSTSLFDARQVDPSTVTIGDASRALVRVARHPNGKLFASIEDANNDGRADLVVHFARTDLAAAGLLQSSPASLTVRGGMTDGCRVLLGTMSVSLVGGAR